MQEELRKRRDETFEMLVVKGYDYSRVVTTLADRYDVVPKNRQRLHQLATEARQDGERLEELKIRRHIDKSVETETELAQSLGAMHEEPDEVQVDGDMSVVEMLSGEQDDD